MTFSIVQMVAILGVIATIQVVGGKFLVDSYIDTRIKVHDRDPYAHAAGRPDRDLLTRNIEELTKLVHEMNQRLSRIEGELKRGK